MAGLVDLEGRSFGPHPLRLCREKSDEFVAATSTRGDWTEAAPPGFIATALFVVAPDLLGLLDGLAVIHGDQSYFWNGPLTMELDVAVSGRVSKVRERGDTSFVTFDLEMESGDTILAGGTSLFLVSGSTPPGSTDGSRPSTNPDDRGDPTGSQRSASRADLVRYAAATRDWNPIHWDHDAALSAGLDGVIAHGLLQASWALDAAGAGKAGQPFSSARFRFRNPLPPATPVDVTIAGGPATEVTLSAGETVFLTAKIEGADE